MAFDAVAVRCLVKDLKDKLINSRIDKIHQPEKDEITINLRTMTDNFKLVLSASPAHPRVHFTNVSKKNPISAPMFCMLLRKHIGSGKITDIEQIGFERIIKFSIESYDELGDLTTKYLIVEIMGRHSNIILTNQDMRILDCIKHIDFTVSSVRQLLPGLDYVSPPVQDKTDLTEISETANIDFSSPIQTADKAILSAIAGISPLTSREIVYRAFGRTDVKCSELTDNGRNKLLYETVKLAKDVVNQLGVKASEKNITLLTEFNTKEREIADIQGDKNRLKQVLINLVQNALKFTEEGGYVVVRLSQGDEYTTFSVVDNGIGIKQENLDKVLEKFFQEDYHKSGSGIGLAISNEIVKLHKGKLILESQKGEGTCITFTLKNNLMDAIAEEKM